MALEMDVARARDVRRTPVALAGVGVHEVEAAIQDVHATASGDEGLGRDETVALAQEACPRPAD